MKQHVLMNKENGELGLGIKLLFFDEKIAGGSHNEYIVFSTTGFDVWAVQNPTLGICPCTNGNEYYLPVLFSKDEVKKHFEILCEL